MNSKFSLKCINCGLEHEVSKPVYTCRRCGDLLNVEFNLDSVSKEVLNLWKSRELYSLWKYRELLPIIDEKKIVSLGEGATKLHKCKNLSEKLNLKKLYVKFEGGNPTGSFKDRGMTVGVTKALELGMEKVICASTGNTSASLAAYAAKANLKCIVVIPAGKVALGKVAQAIIHGARMVQVNGNFDEALKIVCDVSLKYGIYLLNSVNPFRLEGQKTIAFEIWEQMKFKVPDNIVVPVGNAGNISAIWKGFKELYGLGLIQRLPRMIGVQAEGAAPIVEAVKRKLDKIIFVDKPETIATAIRIGRPINWSKALKAIEESNGLALTVSDGEIMEAQEILASKEGLFVEPASATTIAALPKLLNSHLIDRGESTICIATGHGLKDPNIVVERLGGRFPVVNVESALNYIFKL